MATFLLYGKHEITISEKELLYSDAILELNHIAAELGSAYRSLYKAYGSWIEFYIHGEQDGWELINQAATVVVKTYVDIGIFDVTASDVQAHALESIWEWKKLWQRIYSIQDKMDECYQEVCEYRDERKRLRSRTATPGFGV